MSELKGQDILVLLKLASLEDGGEYASTPDKEPYAVRSLAAQLGVSKSEVNAAIQRSLASGLAIRNRETHRASPQRRHLLDFLVHGLKYVFPAHPGGLTRGAPTAFAAPPLAGLLHSGGDHLYVWPDANGVTMGQSVKPLFKSVPLAAANDPRLYEYLALADALRLGRAREAGLAKERLAKHLLAA